MTSFCTPSASRLSSSAARCGLRAAPDLLAASHRDSVVVEHLVGDVHAEAMLWRMARLPLWK
jgi:hypothetical protein